MSVTLDSPHTGTEAAAVAASVPAIFTRDLVKRYGDTTALAGLTMTVGRGEVFGFLGPNGAGKTTAVKLLVGLLRPSAGEALVLGAPVGDLAARRRIGYLPELFRYQEWLSAREVLKLHCALARLPRGEWNAEIEAVLTLVGLASRGRDRVGTFSKGMQQRLGLGVALLGRPELVFLDEPTSALDPVGRHDVREIVHELQRRGTTVFLNSHLLSEVELVCDRVAIVNKGRVVTIGTLREVLGATRSVRVRLAGPPATIESLLRHYGPVEGEADGWYNVEGIDTEAVPDLTAALVEGGVRVYAIEPRHQTLEERFLELLKES